MLGPNAGLLGLFDLSNPYVAPPGAVPTDPREINSDFTPTLEGKSNSFSLEVKQKVTDWLDATLVGGYADGYVVSQESYTNSPGQPFARGRLCGVTPTLRLLRGRVRSHDCGICRWGTCPGVLCRSGQRAICVHSQSE